MPAHAQRISSLLALDKEFAACRVGPEGMRCRARCGSRDRRATGDGGTSSVQGWGRLQIGGRARRGTHVEHCLHVCDAGGVEAQRLVERRRALPRAKRRAYGACEVQSTGRRWWATAVHAACRGGLDCRLGAGLGEERTLNM